jgi:thiamine kinase-like enzyme
MTISIDQIIQRIPGWSPQAPLVTPLEGGLTNRIYRVDVGDESFVVRIPGEQTALLGIDRGNELHNSRAAAEAGVSPRVVLHLADFEIMVIDHLHAETMTVPAMQRPGMPTRTARLLRQLHAGPPFLHDFHMPTLIRGYRRIVREQGMRIPDDYPGYFPQVERIEAALGRRPISAVPCHNDLLAANIMDDGQRLWLIDFEYSGNNDPTFELGNVCQELEYDDPRIEEMCAAYFGEAFPEMLARMKLNMVLANVGWTLWGAIQASVSGIDYDFRSWSEDRWQRARSLMNSHEFHAWLAVLESESVARRA